MNTFITKLCFVKHTNWTDDFNCNKCKNDSIGGNPFSCKYCDNSFTDKHVVKDYENIHVSQCEKPFSQNCFRYQPFFMNTFITKLCFIKHTNWIDDFNCN